MRSSVRHSLRSGMATWDMRRWDSLTHFPGAASRGAWSFFAVAFLSMAGCDELPIEVGQQAPVEQSQPAPIPLPPSPKPVAPPPADPAAVVKRFLSLKPIDITDQELATLANLPSGTEGITEINLANTRATKAAFAHIAKLPNVKSVDISPIPVDDQSIADLKSAPALESLKIGLQALGDGAVPALTAMSKLKKVSFQHARLSAPALAEFFKTHPELEEIDMPDALSLDDESMAGVAELKNLKILRIGRSRVTDNGLAMLGNCPNLELVDLHSLPVTGEGLSKAAAQARGFEFLHTLEVSHTRFGPQGVPALRAMPNLQALGFDKLNLTDQEFGFIASLKKLRRLSVAENTSLTSPSMKHIAALTELEQLKLNGLNLVDDRGFALLAKLPKLQQLEARGTGLSARGAAALRQSNPDLVIVQQ